MNRNCYCSSGVSDVYFQLLRPEPVLIPERYDPDDVEQEQPLTDEERQLRQEKSEKFKKMLAAQRFVVCCGMGLQSLFCASVFDCIYTCLYAKYKSSAR